MSRKSIKEYILRKRDDYLGETPEGKSRMLDEVCRTTELSRKRVIKLLRGTLEYRERKGRGRTYTGKVIGVLKSIWLEAACPCLPHFKAQIDMWIDEYSSSVAVVPDDVKGLLLKMSPRTMARALDGVNRVKPGWSKANKHSGRNQTNEIRNAVPSASGEKIMACMVPPGDVQVDTFALGGGVGADNFFWILTATDRKTQWVELSPAWNRGQHATLQAFQRIDRRLPFKMKAIHPDNGGEILNHHLMAYFAKRKDAPYVWRSRPRKSNDNAHVEQKNGSVGRQLFGEVRLDRPELEKDLVELCEMWSDFTNHFRPSKMLIGKTKRVDGKGSKCVYGTPGTPYQRVLDDPDVPEEAKDALRQKRARLTGIELAHRVKKKLARIKRIQERHSRAKVAHDEDILGSPPTEDLSGGSGPGSALRAAPSGAPRPRPSRKRTPKVNRDWNKYVQEKTLRVAYLANQKPPAYLSGVVSI